MKNGLKRVLVECLVVAVGGLLVGFAANAVNPDGLILSRDYFKRPPPPQTRPASTRPAPDGTQTAPDPGPGDPAGHPQPGDGELTEEEIIAHLVDTLGLQAVTHAEAVESYEDPLSQVDVILFVDARNDDHYASGHIPRAYHLDPYYRERYLDAVLPACLEAQKIIVYCNGGKCEDSEFAAQALHESGIDLSRVFVYAGGFTAWQAAGMPVETGERLSGSISQGNGNHE